MSKRNWRGNLIQQLFILVIFIQASLTHTSSSDIDNIVYLSFSSPKVSAFPPVKYRTSLPVVHSDDSPYSRVKLPWAFNFFGGDIFNIFVDPNGCVHDTYGATSGGPTPSLLNSSYFGTIAGYIADLDPSKSSKTSNITSYIFGDMVSIIFTQVSIFNTSKTDPMEVSFRISLFNDSRVIIDYDALPMKNELMSTGLRAPNKTYSDMTYSQGRTGRIGWKTKVPGVYPDKLSVQTGNQFTACPISKIWGIFPSTFDVTKPSSASLFLKPFYYSCRKDLEIAVLFDKTVYSECVLNDASSKTTQLLCDISNLLATKKNGQIVTGQVAWRLKGSQSLYSIIGASPFNLTMSGTISPTADQYSINGKTPNGCSPKNLYLGNYTCLKLSCPSLYQHPVCGNMTTFTKDICSTDLAIDTNKRCCNIEQQDCAGKCFGKTQIGTVVKSTTKICCIGKEVDCEGYCEGPAKVDACGVCNGKNQLGNDCGTKVFFNTESGRNKIMAQIDYANPRTYTSISNVDILNQNNVTMIVNITRQEMVVNGPVVIAYPINIIVPPGSSRRVTVNVSVSKLINLEVTNWEVKVLVFNYRQSTGTIKYRYPISVYPAASNCSAITGVNSCMRAPACILCAEFPSLRVLTEQKEDWSGGSGTGMEPLFENSNGTMDLWTGDGGVEEWRYYRKRELFTGLIPLPIELNVEIPLTGVCMNGFASAICANAQFSAAPKMFIYPSVILALGGLLSFFLFIQ